MKKRQRKRNLTTFLRGVREAGRIASAGGTRPIRLNVTVGFSRMEGIVNVRGRVVNGTWREDYRRLPDRTAEGPSGAR